MAPKRPLPPPEEAEDGGISRALKRWRPLVLEVLGEQHMQRLLVELEKVLRRVVPEELRRLHANHVYQPSDQDKEIRYRLHFRNKLPNDFFTFNSILAEDGMSLQIALMDSNLREVITSDPLSSVKVEVVVIDGDFVGDRHEYWTEKQFKDRVVPQRDGKGPLLTGELVIKLNKGVGYLAHATFTDNSSWTRSQKFRLGLRLCQSECIEDRVQEGISEPFRVKDRRVESNQKHHSPSLTDDVWRLKNIMKGGRLHQRLVDGGIHTVQQFLQAFTMNHEGLRSLLGDKAKKKEIPNKKWQGILAHAQRCPVGKELYSYSVSGQNVVLIFNSIYELIGAKFDGQYYSMHDLTSFQQESVENWKDLAFKNRKDIHKMDDNLPQPITPIDVASVPASILLNPQIPYCDGKNHDEATTQVGFWHQPNVPYNEHSNVLFGLDDWTPDQATTQVGLWHQPNVPYDEHSNVLLGLDDGTPDEATTQVGLWHQPNVPYDEHSNVLFGLEGWTPDEATTQVGLWHQPNVPHNEHSNVLFGLEDIPVPANRVQSIQESSSLQEPEVSNGLPVGSIPMHPPTAIDTAFRGPILPSYHPATYEAATDVGFQQPLQDISSEQDFNLFPHPAFFHGNVSDCSFGTETGRVDECMLQHEGVGFEDEAVPTSPRKWVKLIAGLKCGLSISKYLAARRLELCIVVSKQ
uniref:Calmodulin-binding protein 60 D isoform X2 n=1 Tax=Elaeis guineensis var. tenera TaxID=51953 RepID=A0A6I9S1C3_ELAGV|nr:calmodulin-binding protein 60 D isoform X2 [Elaeis guineensis]